MKRHVITASRLLNMQSADDSRFPGTGRTLASGQNTSASTVNSDLGLQARLLDSSSSRNDLLNTAVGAPQPILDGR
ncbi:hypothetical protein ACET3Z_006148 [Daucus carota]